MPPTPFADPRFGRFGLRTECPTCGAHLPVNGPASEVECADCGEAVPVPKEVVAKLVDGFESGFPRPVESGSLTVGDKTWRWTIAVVDGLTCPSCSQALTDHLDRPSDGPLTCPGCAATIPCERLPSELGRGLGAGAWVVGGEVDQARTESPARPVALACPNCGAGLSITNKHHRITTCDRCSSQVHVPDVVWRTLHPPRTVQPWLVRFEGESRPAREQRLDAERIAQEKKTKKEREKERLEREAKKREDLDRKAKVDAEEQARLAVVRAAEHAAATRFGVPMLVVAGAASLVTVSLMALAGIWFVVGHMPILRKVGITPLASNLLEDGLVVAALGSLVVAWVLGLAAATRRAGTGFFEVLPWSLFMVGLSVIPFVGPLFSLFFAWQHFAGAEPTVGTDRRVPRFAGWPLGLLHVFGGFFTHLAYAALTRSAIGLYVGY